MSAPPLRQRIGSVFRRLNNLYHGHPSSAVLLDSLIHRFELVKPTLPSEPCAIILRLFLALPTVKGTSGAPLTSILDQIHHIEQVLDGMDAPQYQPPSSFPSSTSPPPRLPLLAMPKLPPPPPAFRYPIAYPTTAGGTPPLAPTSPTPLGHAQASTPPPTFPYPNICSTYSTIPSISSSLGNSPIQCLSIGGSLGGVSSKRPFDRQSPGELVRVEI